MKTLLASVILLLLFGGNAFSQNGHGHGWGHNGSPRDTLWRIHHGTIPPWDSLWVNNDSLGNGHDSISHPPHDTIYNPRGYAWGHLPGIPRDTLWRLHHGTIPPWDSAWVNNDSLGHDSIPRDTCMGQPCDSFGRDHHRIDRSSGSADNSLNMPLSVSIYPNPILENAVVRIQGTEGIVTFSVFESTGRRVIHKTDLTNGEFELNRNNLSPGLYLYEMWDNDNLVSTGRLVFK